MLQQMGGLAVFAFWTLIFPFIVVFCGWWLAPKKPFAEKLATYECGLETQGKTWIQFKMNYFLYALIFVVFDVETVFLYPWAVRFQALGMFAFVEMLIFIGILVLGLWYAWKEGALEWN